MNKSLFNHVWTEVCVFTVLKNVYSACYLGLQYTGHTTEAYGSQSVWRPTLHYNQWKCLLYIRCDCGGNIPKNESSLHQLLLCSVDTALQLCFLVSPRLAVRGWVTLLTVISMEAERAVALVLVISGLAQPSVGTRVGTAGVFCIAHVNPLQ